MSTATQGAVNFPGTSRESTKLVQELLRKDAETHHCYFNERGFHNHLSHHLIAAYDLGAPPARLQEIYDQEAKYQRPINLDGGKEIEINEDNWTQYLGNQGAYSGFFKFFRRIVEKSGITTTLQNYIFSSAANNVLMPVRLVSGALHPIIQLGYGLEFQNEILIATGLAQTAIHNHIPPEAFKGLENPPAKEGTITLYEALNEVNKSTILDPPLPYDPDAFINARVKSAVEGPKAEEIRRIVSKIKFSADSSPEEIIRVATLLLFSTGREGRKPRLDFFLMHIVTSSLFIRTWLAALPNQAHQIQLLRTYVTNLIILVLSRGRPAIKPGLVMGFTNTPQAPSDSYSAPKALNPWPALIESSLHHPDAHVIKTIRTLVFAATHWGDAPLGWGGIAEIDGSIFVRGAGMTLDNMGWVNYGQKPAEDWDRSALGWDDAWKDSD